MDARQKYLIGVEAERVKNHLASLNFKFAERCEKSVAKKILMDGDFFYNGRNLTPVVKNLGLGVYEVTIKERI